MLLGYTDYFYPRSPCGERQRIAGDAEKLQKISIHALLAESDPVFSWHCPPYIFLSTLSLRRATAPFPRLSSATLFLSTLSLRRATSYQLNCCWSHMDFYPRSPCGERRIIAVGVGVAAAISIHALLAESDTAPTRARRPATAFLSTLSLRRATKCFKRRTRRCCDFYPRSPCGERHFQF